MKSRSNRYRFLVLSKSNLLVNRLPSKFPNRTWRLLKSSCLMRKIKKKSNKSSLLLQLQLKFRSHPALQLCKIRLATLLDLWKQTQSSRSNRLKVKRSKRRVYSRWNKKLQQCKKFLSKDGILWWSLPSVPAQYLQLLHLVLLSKKNPRIRLNKRVRLRCKRIEKEKAKIIKPKLTPKSSKMINKRTSLRLLKLNRSQRKSLRVLLRYLRSIIWAK